MKNLLRTTLAISLILSTHILLSQEKLNRIERPPDVVGNKMITLNICELGKTDLCATGFFLGNKHEGEIIFKVMSLNDTLLCPYVFFLGLLGNFESSILGKYKSGFYKVAIKHYETSKIKSLQFVTHIAILVKNGKKTPIKRILIVDWEMRKQINKLITYTKPL